MECALVARLRPALSCACVKFTDVPGISQALHECSIKLALLCSCICPTSGRSAVLIQGGLTPASSTSGALAKGVRRRRTWYRRRLRTQRILMAVVFGVLLVGAFWQSASRYLPLPSLRSSQILPDSFRVRGDVHKNFVSMTARATRLAKGLTRIPGVYPYSVIPGGVKDLNDLRSAALRDSAVRQHYAHFDYSHAQLIRASEAREVYLSYRIRDTVFWTRKRIRLQAGELLLTDGNITARARCGNQISDTAKPEVSDEEPAEDVLDEPVAVMEAPSLAIRPMLGPPALPGGQPAAPTLFAGGFIFPYVPFSGPLPYSRCPLDDGMADVHCHPKHPHVVPEPPSMILIASGFGLILWRYRRYARPVKT